MLYFLSEFPASVITNFPLARFRESFHRIRKTSMYFKHEIGPMKMSHISAKSLALSFMFVFLAAGAVFAAGCGGEATPAAEVEATPTSTGAKPLTEEFLKEIAARRIEDPDLVKVATITTQGTDKFIVVHIGRPNTCHDGAVVGVGVTFAQKVLAQLYKYPEVARVEIAMLGTGQTPNGQIANESAPAIRIVVDRATAQNIDWFQFTDANAPTMANEFYLDPEIALSFAIEGGDPTGPRTQTTTTPAT